MIPVVYEDDWLLVVDKPAGLLTIPTPKQERSTLTSILNAQYQKKGVSFRLHPCHRLDRSTSGLIIYAKGKTMQKKMLDLFRQQEIKKTYIVFCHGCLSKAAGEIKSPVGGKSAFTRYRVIQRKRGFTVLKVMPQTGRTNQIRIHLKRLGHPVVGEDKFIFRRDFELKAKRVCLHAQELEFIHPVTKKNLRLCVGLPKYLKKFLEQQGDKEQGGTPIESIGRVSP